MRDRKTTDDATVRLATEDDAESLARLVAELGYGAEPEAVRERIRSILASPRDVLLAASSHDGAVVGLLQAHASVAIESGPRVEIVGLVVAAAARRAGVGRLLVAAAERWAGSMGIDTVVVRSNVNRVESHAFYPALGYERTKAQHVYKKHLG